MPPHFRPLRWLAVVLALTACGPDTDPPVAEAEFDEYCGEIQPVQLMSLASHEVVPYAPTSIVPHGDGWLVAIAALDVTSGRIPAGPALENSRVVSVDACGQQAPQMVAEGIDQILAPHEPGLPWLGCSSPGQRMVILDPTGQQASVELGTVQGCSRLETPGAIWLAVEQGDREQLLRLTASGDPMAPDQWMVSEQMRPEWWSYAVHDERAWFVDIGGTLHEVDLAGGEVTPLAEGMTMVRVASNARFLAMGSAATATEPGPWAIYDRDTGLSTPVAIDGESQVRLRGFGFSLIFDAPGMIDTTQVVRLPSLETSTFEGRWSQIMEAGPGDLVLISAAPAGDVHVLRNGTTVPELLHDAVDPVAARVDDDALWIWDYYDYATGLDEVVDREHGTELVRIPLDGSGPEVIIDEVFQPLGFDDGRWLTVRDPSSGRGELVVIDPARGTELRVDRGVPMWFARHNAYANPFPGADILPSDEVFFYTVYEGDRTGLWSARLAPP